MREHMGLYRGKRLSDESWAKGNLLFFMDGRTVIHYYAHGLRCAAEVDPDTVGECTGLRDKNGKLIFEGDIVYTALFGGRIYFIIFDNDLCAFIGWVYESNAFTTFGGDGELFEIYPR